MRHPIRAAAAALVLLLPAAPAPAGKPVVVSASAKCDEQRVCRFDVTVQHDDEGWDHYADRWEVVTPKGETLGARVLRHPHVNEQPFQRSLEGVRVPTGVDRVHVRVRDSRHGWTEGEDVYVLRLP